MGHFCELFGDSHHEDLNGCNSHDASVAFLSHGWIFMLIFLFISGLSHTDTHCCNLLSMLKVSFGNIYLKYTESGFLFWKVQFWFMGCRQLSLHLPKYNTYMPLPKKQLVSQFLNWFQTSTQESNAFWKYSQKSPRLIFILGLN